MKDIYLIYNDPKVLRRLGGPYAITGSPFLHFIDSTTRSGKKEAWKIKNQFSAKLDPFIVVYENDKAIKAFYSETGEDVVDSLIKYLNE